MRLRITCMKCFQVDGSPPDEATSVELRDDGLYAVTCSRGHVSVTAIQQQKFEVLFDLGAMALIDGYPREAVSSIAAALERFLEYYVRVVSLKHGVASKALVDAWKPVSRQSERQLGAFLFVYLIENKKPVSPLIFETRPDLRGGTKGETPTWSEFRNRVIHQGHIPSTEDVVAYGDLVYQWIYQLIGELKACCAESMKRVTFEYLRRANDIAAGEATATMSIPTLISLMRADKPAKSFEAALTGLEKYKRWLYESHSA